MLTNQRITIAVRFIANDGDFFCNTLFGYGGSRLRSQLEASEKIRVEDAPEDSTTRETDHEYG